MNELPPDAAALQLADALAARVQRWSVEAGAAPEAAAAAALAARAASLATSNGDACVPLDEVAPDAAVLREMLLACGCAGTPQAPLARPLIVDDGGRLYLHRYFDHERQLAARLRHFAADVPAGPGDAAAAARLQHLFPAPASGGPVDAQKLAAALALTRRLAIVSGGPGTGKTTTLVRLLACLAAQQPGARVVLAAPTGKAAARMTEALRQRAADLPAEWRAALPETAFTVHRLLGARPDRHEFAHGPARPLPLDVLVVDEASMLDLALARRLLDAVPDGARVVLLGDKDQLAAVEAGAVFADLCADASLAPALRERLAAWCGCDAGAIDSPAPGAAARALGDTVVWLRDSHRFAADSGIGRVAAAVNRGDAAAALRGLRDGGDGSLQWLDDASDALSAAGLEQVVAGHDDYLHAVAAGAGAAALTEAFARFRVLCALRDGPRGVAAVNAQVTARLRATLGARAADPRSPWFPGRPVMVLRNDALLGLFNGDVGIALPDAHGTIEVHFPHADGTLRALPPLRLPPHETAFATSVHRAQGSEFDAVMLLLPSRPSRVATRELVYTALTRARRHAGVVGSAALLEAAIATPTRRRSGLAARLLEAAAARPDRLSS